MSNEVESLLPGVVHMISGCSDSQTSSDVYDVSNFSLPDPAGRAGGACTSALLKVLYRHKKVPSTEMTWVQVLESMRTILRRRGFSQVPQLTSSRMVNVNKTFSIVPPDNATGERRAVVVGINYKGQSGQLSGCQNDAQNIREYLRDVIGFPDDNITMLLDDGYNRSPTRSNILKALSTLCEDTRKGDVAFFHYSGHGARMRDVSGDEADGYDETLVPVDYSQNGQIKDDDLYDALIGRMRRGTVLTCLMDCCHSGTVLDLPYRYVADGSSSGMDWNPQFDMEKLKRIASVIVAIVAIVTAAAVAAGGCSCSEMVSA